MLIFAKKTQMSPFFTKVEPTNNKNIVKFVINTFIVQAKSYEFNNIDDAKISPLAQQLFYLPFVKTVYISQNFIAIEKYNIVEWKEVQDEVAESITNYLNEGNSVLIETLKDNKTPITVYAEITPNPSVMKFIANASLVNSTYEYKNIEEAKDAPLAKVLFNFPFTKEIFISANYVSITKYDHFEWQEIMLGIREFIKQYLENNKPILSDSVLNNNSNYKSISENNKEYTDIEKEIIAILNEYVKPAVESDGGNIAFDSYDKNSKTVRVVLQGACSGCPSSTITLKNGIETMLSEMLQGKVCTVEAING